MTENTPAYDPNERRDTPLARKLKARIANNGPMRIDEYMQACLLDETHGYYRSKQAIGRTGDFVTSPEISQIFGELIGIWAAVIWHSIGSPGHFNLVELGPGRGTLIKDALRAAQIVPEFRESASIRLIECNTHLAEQQRQSLWDCGYKITWHAALFEVTETSANEFATPLTFSPAPTILIANEFIDTVPVEQFCKQDGAWRARTVELGRDGELELATDKNAARGIGSLTNQFADAPDGAIVERLGAIGDLTMPMGEIAKEHPIAALFIDYGHESSGLGDTLQAVRDHKYEHPLCSPGEADLTAQVDFEQFAHKMKDTGFTVDGPLPQAEFLGQLGILQRTSKLMSANPDKAADIEAGVMRLMAPTGMGTRFKAIGVRSANVPALPGLQPLEPPQAKR